jgi:hypothetical protein
MATGYQGITIQGFNAKTENGLLSEKTTFETKNGRGTFEYRAGADGAEVEIDLRGDISYDFNQQVEAAFPGDYGDRLYIKTTETEDGKKVQEMQTYRDNAGNMNVIRMVRKGTDVAILVETA